MTAPFVAIDGEAIDGAYVLLARSTGEHVADLGDAGLSTVTCLEFLLGAPRPSILICFGLNYDVNQWLRELPRRALRELWESHYTYWRDYRIEWLPGRWLAVKAIDGRYAKVHEAFGFFQTSFVRSLEDWGLEAPAEVATMKRRRGTFTAGDRQRVIDYCLAECRLLVSLMDELRAACERAEILPRSWIGAGSIATALLGRQKMDRHHSYDLDLAEPETVETAILGAYFGGRVEMLAQGIFAGISTLDLRSAYPAAALDLPSLDGARLLWRRRYKPPPQHGIWRCRWDLRGVAGELMPFPVRNSYSIFYPQAGEGWYHAVEVQAALDQGYPIDVLEGFVLRGGPSDRPFEWIRDVYRQRERFKRAEHPAQKIVKLGLNSIYGKLAQGYGYGSRPRWQSYFWAGYITAATRAKVFAASRWIAPVMISTDGIFALRRGPAPAGRRGLGGWERGRLDRLFCAQPGVYQGHADGREILKSRGFFALEVDYDELREGFEREGSEYVYRYESTRFVGLGAALARRDFTIWRQWVTETRSLLLHPERKLVRDGRLYPCEGPLVSEPYEPKISLLDARAIDYMQGMEQPMREAI